jgi:hypothetical protein
VSTLAAPRASDYPRGAEERQRREAELQEFLDKVLPILTPSEQRIVGRIRSLEGASAVDLLQGSQFRKEDGGRLFEEICQSPGAYERPDSSHFEGKEWEKEEREIAFTDERLGVLLVGRARKGGGPWFTWFQMERHGAGRKQKSVVEPLLEAFNKGSTKGAVAGIRKAESYGQALFADPMKAVAHALDRVFNPSSNTGPLGQSPYDDKNPIKLGRSEA